MDRAATIEWVDELCVMTLTGEIDAFTAPELRREIREALEAGSVRHLLIDLSAVTFLDSAALGAIISALRRVRERDGELRVVAPRGNAARIFELTRLDAVLDLYPTRASAITAATG